MSILIQYTLIFTAVLAIVALGGMFSERSGVINLGIEGCMVIGALGGALVLRYLPTGTNPFLVVVLAILGAVISGILYSLLLAVAAINFGADQTITGTALNILAPAFATVLVKAITLSESGKASPRIDYASLQPAFTFHIGSFECNWFVVIAIFLTIFSYFFLSRRRTGLRLKACGEHPQSAASVGINVIKMRYLGVIISGAFAGIGGLAFICSASTVWSFDNGVVGFGFLALAVMIFGKWNPITILLGALLFGFFRSFGNVYQSFDWIKNLGINGKVYNMLPYIVCLVVLAVTQKKSHAPKAEGIPYDRGRR